MKLPVVSGKDLVKFLSREGFQIVGRKGSHIRMKKITEPPNLITVVPDHNELARGTLLSILRQTDISVDEFLDRWKRR